MSTSLVARPGRASGCGRSQPPAVSSAALRAATYDAWVSAQAEEQDVPSSIDLRDRGDAAEWAATADVKRPWRAEIRAAIAVLVRDAMPPPRRVLELGPGPGLLAEAVLDACRLERYTLLDFSAPMLDMCSQRLGKRPAVDYIQADFTRADWAATLPASFDAVLAMQAVHEIRHKRHTARLYAQVRSVLAPGGWLVVCDHEPFGDDIRRLRLYATVDEQHAALAAAGFSELTTHQVLRGLYLCSGRRPPDGP
jgi:SAM-dependent methyltransferase